MMTDKESEVCLRISSKNMSCSAISEQLGWKPTESFEKGDFYGGRQNKRPREESLWMYTLRANNKILFEKQLSVLLRMILKKRVILQKISKKCQLDIFCSYTTYTSQGGIILESKKIKEIASLDIDLVICFYSIRA